MPDAPIIDANAAHIIAGAVKVSGQRMAEAYVFAAVLASVQDKPWSTEQKHDVANEAMLKFRRNT